MKKKFIALLFAILILPCSFLLSACNPWRLVNDIYYSDVPLDLVYSATLHHYLETRNEAHDFTETTTTLYAVSQKYETVAGENYLVTYVEWRQIGHWWMYGGPYDSDESRTFIHVAGKTFVWEGDDWVEPTSSYYTYESIYLNINDSDSFRYNMTNKLWSRFGNMHRELPKKYKTQTTSEYIEYVCKDNEIFRVSNNKYNVLLKYSYDTHLGSIETQDATFNVNSTSVPHLTANGAVNGAPTGTIPHLDKITAAMLAD